MSYFELVNLPSVFSCTPPAPAFVSPLFFVAAVSVLPSLSQMSPTFSLTYNQKGIRNESLA